MATVNSDNYLITEAVNPIGSNTRQVTFKYTLTGAIADTTVIRLCKIPKGATLTQLVVKLPDLDTHNTPTIVFNYGVEGNAAALESFLADSTVGQAAGSVVLYPFYTATDEIAATMEVETGAATAVTSGTIYGFAIFDFYPKY